MLLIGIGSNLGGPAGSPLATVEWAVTQLRALGRLRLVAVSRWYLTDPVPPSGQPPYLNGIARLEPDSLNAAIDPAWLLTELQRIEAAAGRVRGAPNAARTLDLDIIAMGQEGRLVRASPDPVLPHPRAHQRAFVLVPLRDVAPDWRHPVLEQDVNALISALPPQGIRPLSPAAATDGDCS